MKTKSWKERDDLYPLVCVSCGKPFNCPGEYLDQLIQPYRPFHPMCYMRYDWNKGITDEMKSYMERNKRILHNMGYKLYSVQNNRINQNLERNYYERGICSWCGKELGDKRRLWCGQGCINEYLVRKGYVRDVYLDLQWETDGKYICKACNKVMDKRDEVDVDHIVPLAAGGKNELSNLQLLCIECHKEKTKKDVGSIAEARSVKKYNEMVKDIRKLDEWL